MCMLTVRAYNAMWYKQLKVLFRVEMQNRTNIYFLEMNLAICLARAAGRVPKTAETAASGVNNLFSNLMLHISPANKAKNTRQATNSLLGSAIPWMAYSE